MDVLMMLLVTVMVPVWYLWPSRQISMTFKTHGRSVSIKNDCLAEWLIAEKNVWGIAADPGNRNEMSLWGVVSYLIFLPQAAFLLYNWWVFFETGSGRWCEAGQAYLWAAMLYDAIALGVKLKEAKKYGQSKL